MFLFVFGKLICPVAKVSIHLNGLLARNDSTRICSSSYLFYSCLFCRSKISGLPSTWTIGEKVSLCQMTQSLQKYTSKDLHHLSLYRWVPAILYTSHAFYRQQYVVKQDSWIPRRIIASTFSHIFILLPSETCANSIPYNLSKCLCLAS